MKIILFLFGRFKILFYLYSIKINEVMNATNTFRMMMKNQDTEHDIQHPAFDRLQFLNRREQQIVNSNKIQKDNSFFSGAQSYVNETRLNTIIAEREVLLSKLN